MNRKQFLFSVSKLTGKYIWISLIVIALAGFSSGQTIAGTLTASSTTTTTSGTCSLRTTTDTWTFTDTLNVAHGFPSPTFTQLLLGCSGTCAGRLRSDCTTKCGCPPSGSSTQHEWSSDGRYFLKTTGTSGAMYAWRRCDDYSLVLTMWHSARPYSRDLL